MHGKPTVVFRDEHVGSFPLGLPTGVDRMSAANRIVQEKSKIGSYVTELVSDPKDQNR